MNSSTQRLWWLAVVLFFASGLSSLIYQVLWMHILVLVFGGTTLATSTVLAVFMGGLALGSFLAARVADKVRNPFLWYGVLEGVIGIWALLAPAMFAMATPLYQFTYQQYGTPLAINLVRFLVACLILLPPTTCMGATLPLLARMVTAQLESLGSRVGLLYSVNTIGAVVGTVLAGFFLLPALGMNVTMYVAVLINMLLAAIVLVVCKRFAGDTQALMAEPGNLAAAADAAPLDKRLLAVIVLFGIGGGVSMIYEVAWTRALLLVIGSSTYAFSVMLAAFLIGIVFGSLACSRFIDKQKEPLAWLALLELLAGMTAFLGLVAFGFFPYWNLQLGSAWFEHPWATIFIRFLLAGSILMPLTFCIGATFPAVVKACTRQLEQVGRSVGTVYSANTLGAIIGAFVGGFFLIPALGSEQTLVVAALANVAIGAALIAMIPSFRPSIRLIVVVGVLGIIACSGKFPTFWDKSILLSAQSERRELAIGRKFKATSYAQWADDLRKSFTLEFYQDGIASNVAVTRSKRSGFLNLMTNGHVDASTGIDMAVQQLLSFFPLWTNPGAKEVAVVGWGSGVSVGAAGLFPVKHIDAIELEPAVIKAGRFFSGVNHKPDEDPRVSIIANDGRNYLLATGKKYDVIVSEPSNPWQSGVCNLFTREYFEICKKRLNDGGTLALWLQIAEVSPDSIKQIASALSSVFPYTLTMQPDLGNLTILASDKPIKLNYLYIDESMKNPLVARDLRRVNIKSAADAIGRLIMADDGLRAIAKGVPANTDERNRVEYEVARTYENRLYREDNNEMLMTHMGDVQSAVDFTGVPDEQVAGIMASIAAGAFRHGDDMAAAEWVNASLKRGTNAEAYRVRGMIFERVDQVQKAEENWRQALELDPRNTSTMRSRAASRALRGDLQAARADYRLALSIDPNDKMSRYSLARLFAPTYLGVAAAPPIGSSTNQPDKVLEWLGKLPDDPEFFSDVPLCLTLAADAKFKLGETPEAEALLVRYMKLVPNSFPGAHLMARVQAALGNQQAAAEWSARALSSARRPSGIPRWLEQARGFIAQKKYAQAKEILQVTLEYDPQESDALAMLKQIPPGAQ